MPTTARKRSSEFPPLSRRCVVTGATAFLGVRLQAVVKDSPHARLALLASALTAGNPVAAMECFSSNAADFGRIETYIDALTSQTDVSCVIETVVEGGEDPQRTLETDWLMQLTARTAQTASERRRLRVVVELHLEKNQWAIFSITPLSILFPIQIG